MQLIINSELALQNAIGELRGLYQKHKFIRASLKTGKQRSLDQNALSHTWYEQIARELGDQTALEVKCLCKLTQGVPILRAENDEFRELYDRVIKNRMSYEEKLEIMQWLPVTSIMTVQQLNQYLEAMRAYWLDQNVILQFPPEDSDK